MATFEPSQRQSGSGVVPWSPPQVNWNPWTSSNIDEGPLAFVSIPSCSHDRALIGRPYSDITLSEPQCTPEQISHDLHSELMYQLGHDQNLQKVSKPLLFTAPVLPPPASLQCMLWLQIMEERHLLPVKQFEDEIMRALDCNPVVIIRGATGCGKTTQVPQFILDLFVQGRRASDCNIVVTQVPDVPEPAEPPTPTTSPTPLLTCCPVSAQKDKCRVSGRACRLRERGGSWEKLRVQRPL